MPELGNITALVVLQGKILKSIVLPPDARVQSSYTTLVNTRFC